jgi:hypothetical protein
MDAPMRTKRRVAIRRRCENNNPSIAQLRTCARIVSGETIRTFKPNSEPRHSSK